LTKPFSQEPVEEAIFDALLARRRSLAETADPIKAKRLLSDIKSLNRAADILLFQGVAEHMNVACDEALNVGVHDRIIFAEAKLRPAFLTPAKSQEWMESRQGYLQEADEQGFAKSDTPSSPPEADEQAPFGIAVSHLVGATFVMDGGQAGVSPEANPEPSAEGGWAGTSSWYDEREACTFLVGGEAGTFANGWKAGTSYPNEGEEAGTFYIRGTKAGPIKIELARPHITPAVAEGQAPFDTTKMELSEAWSPLEDVAEGQAEYINGRRAGRPVLRRRFFKGEGRA
jgi:hypothetical protein